MMVAGVGAEDLRVEVRDKQYKPVLNAKVQARFLSP